MLTNGFPSELMDDVNDGLIRVRASKWPAFMYDFSKGYDPNNKDFGLCRGELLVRVCYCSCFIHGF